MHSATVVMSVITSPDSLVKINSVRTWWSRGPPQITEQNIHRRLPYVTLNTLRSNQLPKCTFNVCKNSSHSGQQFQDYSNHFHLNVYAWVTYSLFIHIPTGRIPQLFHDYQGPQLKVPGSLNLVLLHIYKCNTCSSCWFLWVATLVHYPWSHDSWLGIATLVPCPWSEDSRSGFAANFPWCHDCFWIFKTTNNHIYEDYSCIYV